MADPILRWDDYSLDEEHEGVRSTFARFMAERCSTTVVRAAEPLGFDLNLWQELAELGPLGIAVPDHLGGAGGGMVELALVAEEIGRAAAPVPLVETAVAARLLSSVASDGARDVLTSILDEAEVV